MVATSRQRRILLFTPSLPAPLVGGFHVRVYHLARHLAERNQVSILAYARADDLARGVAIPPGCNVARTLPAPALFGGRKRLAQLATLAAPSSYHASRWFAPAMQRQLGGLLAAEPFDLVLVESSLLAGFRFDTRAAVVLDEHNIEYELLGRMARGGTAVRRLFNRLERRKLQREEVALWRRVDGCVLTSAREERIVRAQAPATRTTVVPNGVDLEYFQPAPGEPDPTALVFTGNFGYHPNADAAVFFAREVLPLIQRVRPEARLTLVGRGAPEEVQRLAGPHVVVTGQVADVRPYVAQAGVFVVPLRMGSGTRLKVLEALAMGRPVVSTALGCEGIDVRDGQHLLVAESPADFARAVLRLLDEPVLGRTLAARGRVLVERTYGWPAMARRLEDFLAQVLLGRSAEQRGRPDLPTVTPGAGRAVPGASGSARPLRDG